MFNDNGRGRPRGRSNSYEGFLKSIVSIAKKYKLEPVQLFEALVEAWKNESAQCDILTILCREVNHDSVTFLLTNNETVVSQFPIMLDVLKDPEYYKEQLRYFSKSLYDTVKQEKKTRKISELRYGMRSIDLKAKVIEIPPAINVLTRFGTTAYVSNVKIADESSSIRLSLWNNQIDNVKVGHEIELKACYIFRYRGEPQLRLGRKGTLTIINEKKTDSLHKENDL
jgi:replication factor A1